MFVLSTSNHTYLDMVDCLSLEKVMKKNEKLFALKQLFWFFKNWVVLMVLTANHINHDMVVLDHLTHTHHKPIGLYCPIGPSKTCRVTLYMPKSIRKWIQVSKESRNSNKMHLMCLTLMSSSACELEWESQWFLHIVAPVAPATPLELQNFRVHDKPQVSNPLIQSGWHSVKIIKS